MEEQGEGKKGSGECMSETAIPYECRWIKRSRGEIESGVGDSLLIKVAHVSIRADDSWAAGVLPDGLAMLASLVLAGVVLLGVTG